MSEIGIEDVMKVLEPIWHENPQTAGNIRGRIDKALGKAIAIVYSSRGGEVMNASIDSPLSALQALVATMRGVNILDIGCGDGRLVGQMAAAGANATGVDPNPSAIKRARRLVPGGTFVCAGAEALPFSPSSFDVAIAVNALHHVPVDLMDAALVEASRVIRPEGMLIVIEPLAEGNFFEALRSVEDETAVRAAAQEAMKRAGAAGILRLDRAITYTRREAFDSPADFLRRIVAVDPARGAAVEADRARLEAHVVSVASRAGDGKLLLDQPIRVDVFSAGH